MDVISGHFQTGVHMPDDLSVPEDFALDEMAPIIESMEQKWEATWGRIYAAAQRRADAELARKRKWREEAPMRAQLKAEQAAEKKRKAEEKEAKKRGIFPSWVRGMAANPPCKYNIKAINQEQWGSALPYCARPRPTGPVQADWYKAPRIVPSREPITLVDMEHKPAESKQAEHKEADGKQEQPQCAVLSGAGQARFCFVFCFIGCGRRCPAGTSR